MRVIRIFITLATLGTTSVAIAQPIIIADSGDSAWILTASILLLITTLPGLVLLYAGPAHERNIPSAAMQTMTVMGVVSLIWAAVGYSLSFGDGSTWLGSLANSGLANMADIREGTTVSESVFALFQMMLAIIAPALIVGAFAERVRFGWAVGFTALWSLLIYVPVARWMWGGGWLAEQGALDFAGGIVINTTAGVAALTIILLLGQRKSPRKDALASNPLLTLAGGGLFWIGSLGQSGGSSLAAGADAASAILNSHLAACAAALVWMVLETTKVGKPSSLGLVSGAISGLAAISSSAGFVGPMGAMLLGSIGGLAAYGVSTIIDKVLKTDGALNVFAVFGISGIIGSVAFPLFVLPVLGGPGFDEGITMTDQIAAQAVAVGVTAIWTVVLTVITALTVAMIIPMHVNEDAEIDRPESNRRSQ